MLKFERVGTGAWPVWISAAHVTAVQAKTREDADDPYCRIYSVDCGSSDYWEVLGHAHDVVKLIGDLQ